MRNACATAPSLPPEIAELATLWQTLTPTQRRAAKTFLQNLPTLKPDVVRIIASVMLMAGGGG